MYNFFVFCRGILEQSQRRSEVRVWDTIKNLSRCSRNSAVITTTTNFIDKQIILQKHCPQLVRLFEAGQCLKNMKLRLRLSSNTGYFITQPIRIEYFKHVTELIHSRPISVQDFMGVSTTCKTFTKSLPTFPRHVRHTRSHVSTNFILTSYLALQSGRV